MSYQKHNFISKQKLTAQAMNEIEDAIVKLCRKSPEITANDAGKVLTANADGTAGWKEPTGGTEILTFDSVEEMNASTVPDGTIALVQSEVG